jgi:uncharacterized protein
MSGAKNRSFILFVVLLAGLSGATWFYTGRFAPPTSDASIWFYGGLFALLASKFVTEYRFTKPNDVIINCLAAFVAISTLNNPPHATWWEIVRWGALSVGATALFLAWDLGQESRTAQQPVRGFFYRLVTRLGSAEVLFSIIFVLALLSYMRLDHPGTRFFVVLWGAILLLANLDLASLATALARSWRSGSREVIGVTHSFLSPSVVYCRKLVSGGLQPHQIVGFATSSGGKITCYGMILDERPSATETLIAVALLGTSTTDACLGEKSFLLRLSRADLSGAVGLPVHPDDASKIAGTVANGTNINQIRFEVFASPKISAGSLLSVNADDKRVYFQTFGGMVVEEATFKESSRGFVLGEAEQIGLWDSEAGGFEAHNWVAKERSLVALIDTGVAPPAYDLKADQIVIGTIPGSLFPVNISLNDLVLFHTAILGVTGSGKSFLAYQLIERCAAQGIKVICVDPTGDYQRYLADAVMLTNPQFLKAFLDADAPTIGIIETATNQQNPIQQAQRVAKACLDWCVSERTDAEILEPKPKVLLVLEEAHLLVPEWNFNPDKGLQGVVSTTSQTVLQARKYGLGVLVISQRTANVVKSILNQCNTVISFQAFDETGFDFLKNYMGSFHVQSLPNLKPRHGIIVGKASLSQRPIMTRFTDQARHLNAAALPSFEPPPPPEEVAVPPL